jgi:hypothetical protein
MDAMALLCNMHADGPATIKVLRRAGLLSLADVSRAPHERIADLLGVSPAYARRFAREARLLGERLGESALDVEEAATPGVPSMHAEIVAREHEPERGIDPALQDEPVRGVDSARRHEPELEFDPPAARADSHDARIEPRAELAASRARVVPMSGTRLAPGVIEGLDAAWCDRLVAQGVLTLETLVDAPLMKLARRLGVPLTGLMELQILAQRFLGQRSIDRDAVACEPEPEYVIPSLRRALEGERAGAAPRRALEHESDDIGLRDEAATLGDDIDPAFSGALHLAHRDASEDVGGPFA